MKQEQPTIEGLKFCKKCGKYKPLSEFHRNNRMKDKHDNKCKECRSKYQREYKAKNIDKVRAQGRVYYASSKEKRREYSMTKYYSTDYLEKKYLKRYRTSLEKVLAKKAYLENTIRWNKNPTYNMKQKMQGYESAIEKWKNKIREAEELMALYAENKAKTEEEVKLEPIQPIDTEDNTIGPIEETEVPKQETPKEEQNMTKEQLISLLADVPDHAQIIYVGDTDSRSSLVAAWRPEPNTVCIRNLTQEMPYVITEGALYNMVSASTPFINEGRRMGQED